MAPPEKSVLFVCLGNICRSVMAESILKHMVSERGQTSEWTIDSAATSDYEIGSTPDSRTNDTLRRNNLPESEHIARQITKRDYDKFRYIFGFDLSNMSKLDRLKPPGSTVVVEMFGKYGAANKDDEIVKDPYYLLLAVSGGVDQAEVGQLVGLEGSARKQSHTNEAFDKVYEQCWRSCEYFLDKVVKS